MACENIYFPSIMCGFCDRKTEGNAMVSIHGTYCWRIRTYYSKCLLFFLYIYGSVHREWNLMTVQQDATYSVYYISVGSSTCFRC